MIDAKLVGDLRQQLQKANDRLRHEIAELREASKATTYLQDETDAYDQNMADDASILTERQTDMGLTANLEQELGAVTRAIDQMDNGTYGTCEICGNPIAEARLKARPASTTCITCQSAVERHQKRQTPVEPT